MTGNEDSSSPYRVSGITVIYMGIVMFMAVILLIMFFWRQAMRRRRSAALWRQCFTTPIGHGASAKMRNGIKEKMALVEAMRSNYMPRFSKTVKFDVENSHMDILANILADEPDSTQCRMMAMDLMLDFDSDLRAFGCPISRAARAPLYTFLLRCRSCAKIHPSDMPDTMLEEASLLYERARRSVQDFGSDDLRELRRLVAELRVV